MCCLAFNLFLVVIGDEHNKDIHRRVGDDIANAGATHQGNRNALHVQAASNDQVPMNPPDINDGEVREACFK